MQHYSIILKCINKIPVYYSVKLYVFLLCKAIINTIEKVY